MPDCHVFDQVPGGKAIESFGIESKLAPSF
jgi:hypothetical protein